jgi:putative transcriptional regulator
MASKRKYRSKVAEAVHEGVRGMHRLGLIDQKTMREFDVRCFAAVDGLHLAPLAGRGRIARLARSG